MKKILKISAFLLAMCSFQVGRPIEPPKTIDELLLALEGIDQGFLGELKIDQTIINSVEQALKKGENDFEIFSKSKNYKTLLAITKRNEYFLEKIKTQNTAELISTMQKNTSLIERMKCLFLENVIFIYKCNLIKNYFIYVYPQLQDCLKPDFYFLIQDKLQFYAEVKLNENYNPFIQVDRPLLEVNNKYDMENKDLVFVLAHEFSHIIHGDALEALNNLPKSHLLSIFLGLAPADDLYAFFKMRRRQEYLADLGTNYYFKIPKKMGVSFLIKSRQFEFPIADNFLSSHPNSQARINNLKKTKLKEITNLRKQFSLYSKSEFDNLQKPADN